ncbi:hypothetical protein D3C75_547940 [compost metagenome]
MQQMVLRETNFLKGNGENMSLFKKVIGVSYWKMFCTVMVVINLFVWSLRLMGQSPTKIMEFFIMFNLTMPLFMLIIGFLFWVGDRK